MGRTCWFAPSFTPLFNERAAFWATLYRRSAYDQSKWITPHDRDLRYGHGPIVLATTDWHARVRVRDQPKSTSARPSNPLPTRSPSYSWTTRNPGGTILHYAIVHYGKDPNHLDLTAVSPTRINPSHSDMVFRVRMNDLQPETTYYY